MVFNVVLFWLVFELVLLFGRWKSLLLIDIFLSALISLLMRRSVLLLPGVFPLVHHVDHTSVGRLTTRLFGWQIKLLLRRWLRLVVIILVSIIKNLVMWVVRRRIFSLRIVVVLRGWALLVVALMVIIPRWVVGLLVVIVVVCWLLLRWIESLSCRVKLFLVV